SHIVQAGLHTAISTVATHKNLHSEGMQTLFRFARENRYRIDVQVAQPVGMWEGRMDLLIDQEDAAYLRALRDPSQTNLNGQVLVNRDLYPTLCREGCPAVKEFLSITTKGEVLPCTFIQISLGNIRNRSLKEMRAAALRNEYFALYNPTCLSGEDRGFIDRYLARVWGQDKPGDGTRIFAGDRPTQASSPPNEDADRRTVSSR
ncbi:MAG TPA: SPASM domain-containing protein, partial [Methylomirabilota bacterium]|nr:SPASM domain-containing protein [Methylomirabilota bacterium]